MNRKKQSDYRTKHPSDTQAPHAVMTALEKRIRKGVITCEEAHAVARQLKVSARQVGVGIDLSETQIKACQLGLFEKHPADLSEIQRDRISPDLEKAIGQAMTDNGLACIQAWKIADRHGMSRLQVGRTCDVLGIKIRRCQLGAF